MVERVHRPGQGPETERQAQGLQHDAQIQSQAPALEVLGFATPQAMRGALSFSTSSRSLSHNSGPKLSGWRGRRTAATYAQTPPPYSTENGFTVQRSPKMISPPYARSKAKSWIWQWEPIVMEPPPTILSCARSDTSAPVPMRTRPAGS